LAFRIEFSPAEIYANCKPAREFDDHQMLKSNYESFAPTVPRCGEADLRSGSANADENEAGIRA
jgi:hypothetical protein